MTRNFFFILSVHHGIGYDLENSVIASAATGGTMGGLFNILENIKEIFNLCVLLECVEYIEICYVLAVADFEIGCGFCIYGLQVTGFLFVCHGFVLRVVFY